MAATKSLRPIAAKHLEAAKAQLELNTEQSLRYACLDLRMAIECLTYDLLALYRDDVLDPTLNEWKADKILTALKKIDPSADAGPSLQIADKDGEFGTEGSIAFNEHRFEAKWATKAYHTLGRYLHERTFVELEKGNVNDWDKVRDRTAAIASEIEAVLNSSGWGLKFNRTYTIPCDCGQTATYKMGPLQLRSRARCEACPLEYEVFRDSHDAPTVKAILIADRA